MRELHPFERDGDNVLAYRLPSRESGGEIVSIEPKQGKQTKLLEMPLSADGEGEQAFPINSHEMRDKMLYAHNRLFLFRNDLSQYSEHARKLAVGFALD